MRSEYQYTPTNKGGNLADYIAYHLRIFDEEYDVMQCDH